MESGDNISVQKVADVKKICQTFQSQDRRVRQRGYVELQNFLSNQNDVFTDQDLRNIFNETHMYFLNGLRDKSEAVREQAIKFSTYLITTRLPINDYYLTYIFPIIVERIGMVELVEDSEEIRLKMVQLLNSVISTYSNTPQLRPFFNDCVIVLCESVKDKYPAIKELSCQTIVLLAKSLPMDFHLQADSFLKPVITCFSHQRYKVRIEAIRAVGEIIMHASYKGVDEAMVPMAEKLFDQIPVVRQAVAQEAARWLLEQRDRYSYFHKMLPLLITGLNDEVESTRQEAHVLWEKVGLKFQKENEKDLKDKLDFLLDMPEYYPPHLKRPNLGCRVLVQRNISKLAGAIANELTSWQADVRVRCSQLLCSLALHAEEDLTFNLQNVLPAMYAAARDEDQRVVANIIRASEIIGLFVTFETWSQLVLPMIEDGPHYGHLTVLAGLIEGSPKERIAKDLDTVSDLLAEDYICSSRKEKYQLEQLKCVRALLKKYDPEKSTNTGYNLFKMIVTLCALGDPENFSSSLYNELANGLGLADKSELFHLFSNKLFIHVNNAPNLWTTLNERACMFIALLTECDTAILINLDVIQDVLAQVLHDETDAEMRLKTLYELSLVLHKNASIFEDNPGGVQELAPFLENLIMEILVPCLIWHAGATAEAIRTMAATCLKFAMHPIGDSPVYVSVENSELLKNTLLPLLLSLLEDSSGRSRKTAIECISRLKADCDARKVWWNEDYIRVYQEILKRLDDPTDEVQHCALANLSTFLDHTPDEFLQPTFKAHRDLIIDTLMTHLDEPLPKNQEYILDALKVVARMNPSELQKKMEVHRPLMRNEKSCDEILRFIEECL